MSKAHLDWAAIKKDFLSGKTLAEISRTYGVDRKTIKAYGTKQGWFVPPTYEQENRKIARKAAAQAANELANEKAIQSRAAELLIQKSSWVASLAEEQLKAALTHYARTSVMGDVAGRVMDLIQSWLNGTDKERAKAAEILFPSKGDSLTGHLKTIMSVFADLQRLERETLGLRTEKTGVEVNVGVQLTPPAPLSELSDDALSRLRDLADQLARTRPEAKKD